MTRFCVFTVTAEVFIGALTLEVRFVSEGYTRATIGTMRCGSMAWLCVFAVTTVVSIVALAFEVGFVG